MQIDLTNISKKYKGLWVALNDKWDTVISSNKDITKAHKEAIEKGYNEPIMFKVPKKNTDYFGNSANG